MTKNQNKFLKKSKKIVDKINDLSKDFELKSNIELKNMTTQFKERLKNNETLDDILVEAFATVKEASRRTLNMTHYDVQLIGGIALHNGCIAEMKTGEGKTLVATTAVYLNALTGKGVHVITANEYLAKRDKEIMEKLYNFLGLTVGVILPNQSHAVKQREYARDIVYGTNNEFGFDYLKDNMVEHQSQKLQRELNFAIVDEVDSILIDEARTPLIISGAGSAQVNSLYMAANSLCLTLNDDDYEKDEKSRSVNLTSSGIDKAEKFFGIPNLMDIKYANIQHHINQALLAHFLHKKEYDYIVKNGEVLIVDEFTGRIMPGRRYSAGLHQAIEAKEGVEIQRESKTLATITFQNYFRLYNKLAGMTGTAKTEEEEFKTIYGLDVIQIPTNKPIKRTDHPDRVFTTKQFKVKALVEEIKTRHKTGQPILVGTASILDSEIISNELKRVGLKHTVLNAKNHEKEASIIAQAGRIGAITIATNMAGRGTDIIIGGNAEIIAREALKCKHNLSNSDIECIFNTSHSEDEQEILDLYRKELEIAKKKINEEYQEVINAGGLCVLGTERHESRRIDLQLKGRSGRQGDLGESIFFISLEDDLMRIFGGDAVKRIAQQIGVTDETLTNNMLTRRIEKAQKLVESRNFAVRKQIVKYDDILNSQRKIVYKFRDNIINSNDLTECVNGMIKEVSEDLTENMILKYGKMKKWDTNLVESDILEVFPINKPISLNQLNKLNKSTFTNHIQTLLIDEFKDKINTLGNTHAQFNLKNALLDIIDTKWVEHIDTLNNVKDGIHFRSIGQEDPVVAYRLEGIRLYDTMTINMAYETIIRLLML